MGQIQCCISEDIDDHVPIPVQIPIPKRIHIPKKIPIPTNDEWWGTCYNCNVLTWNIDDIRYICKRCQRERKKSEKNS